MDKKQAEQLAELIRREAPHLLVKVDTVEAVGWQAWAAYVYADGLSEPLPMESPSAWELHRPYFQLPPSSTNE